MSNFIFLQSEWSLLHDSAKKSESAINSDPRTSCFYARRTLEITVAWLYKHDSSLRLPYQDNLSALIHEPTFKSLVGDAVFNKARIITKLGNEAVHSLKQISAYDATAANRELFHICYWIAKTYSRKEKPSDSLVFNPNLIPKAVSAVPQNIDQLQKLETDLKSKDEKLSELLRDRESLDEQLKRLRIELESVKNANAKFKDSHDYNENQTRDYFIDLLLKEAGWALKDARDREYPVKGMPNNTGDGFVDYVLWGDDGKPLGLVEAKRSKRNPREGEQQAKLYADCLEKEFGQRPIIFYTNGYKHWIWDDQMYPQREVQGFYKKQELELLIQRRSSRKVLSKAVINSEIVERYYQTRAIRKICESFEKDKDRKALLVMATGAGKTRTVIALSDVLIKNNWAKRILFLADRVALVKQAANAFKKFLPDSSPVNLVSEKETEGRVFVSTYPTMMGLIDEKDDTLKRFGPGHFDLIIIDEAHRSIFQKYRGIFDYFDSLLVGLTATPRDEVGHNTYGIFDLEDGVPTDAYELNEAISDKHLVKPKAMSVSLKFQREGLKYDELSDEEQEAWDEIDWDEDDNPGAQRTFVEPEALNKWLFNIDTVDKVLANLMTSGLKVAGGDQLGKTIIFAKNQKHAEFIQDRFNKNYPHYKGEFARIITFKTEYAQSLIDSFSKSDRAPHIAISVDMLDTGIDVPEILNLVFFKIVRSKTKFWQMLGRGTRLCKDVFGPGQDKKCFYVFDYCQNLEFFNQNIDPADVGLSKPLGQRLFITRLQLLGSLADNPDESQLVTETKDLLQKEVASMNLDNFVVRTKRELVEKYAPAEKWKSLADTDYELLAHEVSGLPSEIETDGEEAKRFDLIMLQLQLDLMHRRARFATLMKKVKSIADLLEEKSAIPMVAEHLELILDIQTDDWWQDVTLKMLESARKKLRLLVRLIEKRERKVIITDFEDEIGDAVEVELDEVTNSSGDYEKFREKAKAYLRQHEDHLTLRKLKTNVPLTVMDLKELERIFKENSLGSEEDLTKAAKDSKGLGLFVRSLVGLDRAAAKKEFEQFLNEKVYSSNQIIFVNMIIEHLTQNGVMDVGLLYEAPFTDVASQGPDVLFNKVELDLLVNKIEQIRETAMGA
jgi:type I restriction enzyme, R subunit